MKLNRLNYLRNLMHLPVLYFRIIKALQVQQLFLKKSVIPCLSDLLQQNDGSFNQHDFKKITDYYGLAVPAILGEAFCILCGRKMSSRERLCSTASGALSGLLDDFFDHKKLSDKYLRYMIENPFEADGQNTNEKIFLHFAGLALKNSSQHDKLKSNASRVFKAQIKSRKQNDKSVKFNEITDITRQKGGTAFLFYLSAFDSSDDAVLEAIFFQLGALMQYENDLFDIYNDSQANIYTIATITKDLERMKINYDIWTESLFELVSQSGFKPKNKARFLRFVSIVICRGLVCINQLQGLPRSSSKDFKLSEYTRKELICDMEKPANFIKMIHYYAKQHY
jgi:hypothetical protein